MLRTTLSRALLVAALALLAPASANASSLVYVKDGNVWLAAPDGSNQYQVTTDGTTSDPYYKPSQADDGTIVAVRGTQPAKLYRMRQNGELLNAPFATASPLGDLLDAEVSPDGRTVAYTFVTAVNGCYPYTCTGTRAAAAYTAADHFADAGGLQDGGGNWHNVSWAGSGRALLTSNSNLVYYDDVGGGDNSNAQWFDECSIGYDCSQGNWPGIHDLHVTRDGRKATWIVQAPDPDPNTVSDDPYLQIGTTGGDVATGAPPSQPGSPACNIGPGPKEQAGPGQWDRPTFAPDGVSVAWGEADGVHVTSADLNNCSAVTGGDHLVIAGGSEPFWGPADVNPGPRSTGGGGTGTGGSSGTTTPTSGGTTNNTSTGGQALLAAPKLTLLARLSSVVRKRLLLVRCALAAPGTCSLRATITGVLARKLHLSRNRRARTFTLARGRAKLGKAGTASVRLRLSRSVAARLRHVRSLSLVLRASASYANGSRRSTTRRVTLRR